MRAVSLQHEDIDVAVTAKRATDEMLDRIPTSDPPGKGCGREEYRDVFGQQRLPRFFMFLHPQIIPVLLFWPL